MRINLVPEEKRVKPLYHTVPRVVPLHWREEGDKIVKKPAEARCGAQGHFSWPSLAAAGALGW